MYSSSKSKMLGTCVLVAGLVLLCYAVAMSSPGSGCKRECANRQYFMHLSNNDSSCWKFDIGVCHPCVVDDPPGQCIPTGVEVSKCAPQTSLKTGFRFYSLSSCDTPCSTVLVPGFTEATEPSGTSTYGGQVDYYACP
jgi:hypothetical protein